MDKEIAGLKITENLLPKEVREEFIEATKRYALPGIKYAIKYRGKEHYVVISKYKGRPVELFISTVLENDPNTAAGITALTRFISMALKAYELNEVIKQLDRASLSHHDLPGLLAKLLRGDHVIS